MKRFAVLFVGATLVAATAPAIPAAADGGGPIQLAAPTVTVKSSGGEMLHMVLGASKSSSGTQVTVTLQHAAAAGNESHTWTFGEPASVLTYTAPKGKLATGSRLGAYGAISLTFTKVSSTTRNCTGYTGKTKVVTTIVKLSGKVAFAARDTNGPSKWGSIKAGSSSSPFTFGGKKGAYVTQTNGPCQVNFPTPKCFQLWTWTASNNQSQNGESSLEGDDRTTGSTTTSTVIAFMGRALPSPSGASRIDTMTVRAPAPQFNGSANPNTLHVSTTAGTAASGGGTMTASGNPSNPPGEKCTRPDGSTTTETTSAWNSTWANDSSKLTVVMDIGGTLTIADGNQGYFEHISYS